MNCWVRVGRPRKGFGIILFISPQWERAPGRNRAGKVILVQGDPWLEGAGLGFSSSLPVLLGVGTMLRLTPSLCPDPSKPTQFSLS